jgi:hypothetical protein
MSHPKILAILPDGTTHTATARHRARTQAGDWQYFVEVWFDHPTMGGGTVRRREQWWLPAGSVQPIDGEDYTVLTPPAEGEWIAGALVGRDEVSIHRPGCYSNDGGQPITTEAARDLVLDQRAFLCLNCHPSIPYH